MKTITISSSQRDEMLDITRYIALEVKESGLSNGICVVFTQHTTCGLTINENADPDVRHDILLFLRNLIPQNYPGFRHFEHNSDSHIKASLMGFSVMIPFENGELLLGRWQGIYLCEFDGPRERSVIVSLK
jgi:secondary thiamine-phosphate synthase enzyme